ncbi:hypothetical protein E8E13_010981 [Curvularia kusanoi]|uniref:BTB domain-containing protein n=1 Tax=Curvularia kusanoi TaxID=90978 RepID=A0A9P4WAP1_CURKU|nr:hypothetical protein E8E13_010981 [Curvularia kusanoi]
MANGNIGHVPAATFAEYVDDPFFERVGSGDMRDSDSDSDSDGYGEGDRGASEESLLKEMAGEVAPDADADAHTHHAPRRPCLSVRPALAHRLYSHRLHVRAKAKLQRDRLLSGPMIDIYVGEERRRWTLHRNLLCHHSEQLETELEGTSRGDRKEELELPELDPAGFELLVKWLYQGKLDDVSDIPDAGQKYEYAVHCHALYLLCDRFDMPQLKNVAMDQFRKGLNEAELVPDPDEIDDIYRKSPPGSPFRRLMVKIAARQIMDPDSERDTESYRGCFENNAEFAIELVNAIRRGTGGVLLDDPTEKGNECEYHDHEDEPHCNIKGKGKGKQVRKARAPKPNQSSASSPPSISSAPQSHPLPQPQSTHPLFPPHPPRLGSSSAGHLLRRLTSPAISTAGTSAETAVASHPPSPDAAKDWEKLKRAITPEKTTAGEAEVTRPATALDDHPQSLGGASPPQPPEAERDEEVTANGTIPQSPPRRGIWNWARAGTGKLNIIGRLPHPEWKSPGSAPKAEGLVVNGASETGKTTDSHDDFEIPSATATDPDNLERQELAAVAKIEGLGISSLGTMMSPNDFSQTKRSSDDLIANASETTGSPSPTVFKHGAWTTGDDTTPTGSKVASPATTPNTPTPPHQRRSDSIMDIPKLREKREISHDTVGEQLKQNIAALTPAGAKITENGQNSEKEGEKSGEASAPNNEKTSGGAKRRIPTYKIALASNFLPAAGRRSTSAAH